MDLKSTFWKLELAPASRYLTVFQVDDKLCCYKRLTMVLKPSQEELNAALRPVFSHLKYVHLIHDDIIIAIEDHKQHIEFIEEVMETAAKAGKHSIQKNVSLGKDLLISWE